MNLREQFERLHPVPRGVEFCDGKYSYEQDLDGAMTPVHQFRWQGFQSGYAAGMERAAGICDNADKSMHPADLADFIRAAKEQK